MKYLSFTSFLEITPTRYTTQIFKKIRRSDFYETEMKYVTRDSWKTKTVYVCGIS